MKAKKLVTNALIAALYAGCTLALAPISYGVMQFRVSEALTLLPFIRKDTIWGITIGCLLANFLVFSLIPVIRRKHDSIGIVELGESGIGHHGDAMGSLYYKVVGHGYCRYREPGTAHYINGGEGLNLFETIGKEYIHCLHNRTCDVIVL